MSTRTRTRHRAGFTLIELLVAIALGVMLMTIVAITFARVSEIFNLATARIEAVQNGRVALDMIEADLRGAVMDPAGNSFMGAVDGSVWAGIAAPVAGQPALWLTSASEGDSGAKVLYYVTTPPATASFHAEARFLQRYVDLGIAQPATQPTTITASSETSVAYGVRSMTVRYLDRTQAQIDAGNPGQWRTAWDSQTSTADATDLKQPAAVLVHLELIDRKGRLLNAGQPVIMERIIEVGSRGINE
jgi:prepilin-type N-terminal cleavage/methylation domain-containing protein